MDIRAVPSKYDDQLMQLPNVIGVSVGERRGKKVIKVLVTRKVAESTLRPHEIVPKMLEGFETDVEEIGTITAQSH